MTRILVIGSSHMGAIRSAADRIERAFPDLDLTYFGIPGARFTASRVSPEGIFQTAPGDKKARKQALQINGTEQIDLTEFDRLLVVGHRFRLGGVLRLCMEHDVAEWPRRKGRALISEEFLNAAITGLASNGADEVAHQFGLHRPTTAAAAAFPSAAVTRRGRHFERLFADIAKHPERQSLHDLYQTAIAAGLSTHGYDHLPQPRESLAGAFLTKESFALGAEDIRDASHKLPDRRHMNADFGYLLFCAFAQAALGRRPEADRESEHSTQ